MSDGEPFYRVPASTSGRLTLERGGRLGLTLTRTRRPRSVVDHAFHMAVGGVIAVLAFHAEVPLEVAIGGIAFGAFYAGYAFNDAVIAVGCERVDGAEVDDGG